MYTALYCTAHAPVLTPVQLTDVFNLSLENFIEDKSCFIFQPCCDYIDLVICKFEVLLMSFILQL